MSPTTSSATQVWVCFGSTEALAGRLYVSSRGRGTSATFSYDEAYLRLPGAYALDPGLPLRLGAQQTPVGQSLFGAFTDCAPDRWGRTLVIRREAAAARSEGRPARRLGELDFLLGVRDDLRQGALRFRREGPFLATEESGVPALTDLPALLDLADRAEDRSTTLPDLQRLVRAGSSLGGARPKAHVCDGDRVAIAKFPSAATDTWNVMAWEKVALDLAAAAGVVVPRSTLLDLAGRRVLVLDRFDRTGEGERIGYVSAMTMLEATDGDQRSYLDIAEVIERTSADPTDELAQLWRRMVFNVLISNTDDHLRNHGFLHVRGEVWRLAPAFDLNPNPAPGPTYLSTTIDESDDVASLEACLRVADYFRVSRVAADAVVEAMVRTVSGWRGVARRHGLSVPECDEMAPAFAAADR